MTTLEERIATLLMLVAIVCSFYAGYRTGENETNRKHAYSRILMITAVSKTKAGKVECSIDVGEHWFPAREDGTCHLEDAR